MTPDEVRALLDELRACPSAGRAQRLADRLREALCEEPWVDALLADEISSAVTPFFKAPPWAPKPLGPGETWLLLYFPRTKQGAAARVRAVSAPTTVFGADAVRALRVAREGLLTELGRICRRLPDAQAFDFDVPWAGDPIDVDGPSLGVSSCVAAVSRGLGVSPRMDVAATAAVSSDGALAPVGFVDAKLAAIAERWPCVRRVVVAREQVIEREPPGGIEVVRHSRLHEALPDFGLDAMQLELGTADDVVGFVDTLERNDASDHGTTRWTALSLRALEAAHVLHADGCEARRTAKSLSYAALFALHGGDTEAANRYLELRRAWALPETDLPPALRAWMQVVAAAAGIDERPDEAAAAAREGVRLARDAGDRDVLGRAVGTLGRALLHAGSAEEALPLLREAVAVHAGSDERFRSATYVMCCLRKLGRAEEALAVAEQTAAEIAGRQHRQMLRKTRLFVELERGRSLLELGRYEQALAALCAVRSEQETDFDYPRLGATRSLATAFRAAGRPDEGDAYLQACLHVVQAASAPVLRRAAAIAALELLVDHPEPVPAPRLEHAVQEAFPEAKDDGSRRELLRRWVY